MTKKANAFTIVELLIVIVVIAVLAAISIVAYSGIQDRAHDSKRASDMGQVEKALKAYDAAHGGVRKTRNGTNLFTNGVHHQGWNSSVDSTWLAFLRDEHGEMPVDPVNTIVGDNPPSSGNRNYYYHCYDSTTSASMSPSAQPFVRIGYHKSNNALVQRQFDVTACLD